MSEEDRLISAAVGGNSMALELLLRANSDRLHAYVGKTFPPALLQVIEPKDIVQETFFEVCRLIPGFRSQGPGSFGRWMMTIARRLMTHMKESPRGRHIGIRGDDDTSTLRLLEELVTYRRTPSRSAAAHELMAALDRALEQLPKRYRDVVICRHLEGLTVDETASKLSTTSDDVYVLCSRALKAIREELHSASFFI